MEQLKKISKNKETTDTWLFFWGRTYTSSIVRYSVKSNPYPPEWQSESAISVI
jgi:hypothetical protein